jgi:hypothetical protein
MSGDFKSVLQDQISEAIPSQKYCLNIHPILSGFGVMDVSPCSFGTHARSGIDVLKWKPAH